MWIWGLVGGLIVLFFCFSKSLSQSSFSSLACGQSAVMGIGYSFGQIFPQGVHIAYVVRGLNVWRLSDWRLSGWCFGQLCRCRGLLCSFCFLDFNYGKPIFSIKPWWKPTLTFLGLESLSLLGLLIGETLV